MCRRIALSILTAIPLALSAGHGGAAELNVVGAGAIEEPFEALTAEFSRASGHKVHAIFGPVGGMQAKLKGGEKADVIVLSTAAMDALDKDGALVAGSRAELGRATAGIAVRTGAPVPDISSPDALKKTLIAARTIAYTNPAAGGTAGIYMTGLLERLGLTEEVKKKALLEASGRAVAAARAGSRPPMAPRRSAARSPASCCPTKASRWSGRCRSRSGSSSPMWRRFPPPAPRPSPPARSSPTWPARRPTIISRKPASEAQVATPV